MKILSCGESLFDMLPAQLPEGMAYLPVPGGSPLNMAIASSRQGVRTGYLTRLSTDQMGDRLFDYMRDNNLDTSMVVRGEGLSTLGFVFQNEAGTEDYIFYSEKAADRMISPLELPKKLPSGLEIVHLGSLGLQMEPCASTFEEFMWTLPDNILVSLDPNVRTFIIKDRSKFIATINRILPRVSILKSSLEDLEYIFLEKSEEWILEKLTSYGIPLLLITKGSRGGSITNSGRTISSETPKVQVVDTVGCGDSFMGGTLATIIKKGLTSSIRNKEALSDDDLRNILSIAIKTAAINASRKGCDPPNLAEVLSF